MDELKYSYKYPHPAMASDCVIFGFDGVSIRVLLIQRGVEPFKGQSIKPKRCKVVAHMFVIQQSVLLNVPKVNYLIVLSREMLIAKFM